MNHGTPKPEFYKAPLDISQFRREYEQTTKAGRAGERLGDGIEPAGAGLHPYPARNGAGHPRRVQRQTVGIQHEGRADAIDRGAKASHPQYCGLSGLFFRKFCKDFSNQDSGFGAGNYSSQRRIFTLTHFNFLSFKESKNLLINKKEALILCSRFFGFANFCA